MNNSRLKTRRFIFFFMVITQYCFGQAFDTSKYLIKADSSGAASHFFRSDNTWLGADGAAAIDLGNDKLLWLFSDSFIGNDATKSRTNAVMIRNSIAIQDGFTIDKEPPRFIWNTADHAPRDFFYEPGKTWYWTGHGTMVKDKLLVFLMKVKAVKTGLGFEVCGWTAVLVANPHADPLQWKMKYINGTETFGLIAGSAAVLKDDRFIYAYGAVEPATHEVYLLRWNIDKVYRGDIKQPDWWIDGQWRKRTTKAPIPEPLFIGGTEFSVHFDNAIKKFVQVQSYGFGEAKIGIRLADSIQGKWSDPYMVYTPNYKGARQPFMYAAKAHPELKGNGIYITYNVNSFDFNEVLSNQSLYYPRFMLLNIQLK
ncbi:DUF4185 domain-containing protein [Flavihumibacter fluvii]|uniref:DUF4185 domain-containing protein n=1 Tax=Flavihumibacter fluvii TaxID=2838157 RepID=UPI001BDECEAB|nr:DUF4185 domain-containing protein [Flavihumibacter fluvii]ULQ53610.1 DUF4185 domain-containing protein [Flavihumibacter fluvii]